MRIIILGSGSKGNSTLLIGKNKKILIDVGFSYPQMIKKLDEYHILSQDIDAILLTHTHKDHISGLKTFVKRNYTKVYTNKLMYPEIKDLIDENFIIFNDQEYDIDEFHIDVFHTSHDAQGSVGFIINDLESSLVYVTDTGYLNKDVLLKLHNKNIYIFESNHDVEMLMKGPYPYVLKQRVLSDKGHMSNELSGEYLKEIIGSKTKIIVLAHLSEINNTEELALKTVSNILHKDIPIITAKQRETIDLGEILCLK